METASRLPDPSYILIAAVVLAIFAVVGIGVLLKFSQSLRKGIASELKRELSLASEPSAVAVQQPLMVAAHSLPATVDQVETVKTEVHGRIKRERAEIDLQIQRVEQLAERRSEKLEFKIDENTKLTAAMSGEVKQINQSVNQLTTGMNAFFRDQAKK